MTGHRKIRSPRGLLGLLALLLLIVAMLLLSTFLAGFLPGGGRLPAPDPARADRPHPGTLQVTVLGSDRRDPVAGARILVERPTGGEARARSGADGRAVLEGLGAGPVRVRASFQGRSAEAWADPSLDGEVLLAVAEGPTRTGTVRRADGAPAPARVLLLDAHGEELASTQTDARGAYALPDHPDAVAVCAEAPVGAPTSVREGDVVVEPGVEVEGRLLGASEGNLQVYGRVPAPRGDGVLPFRARWPVAADGSFRGRLPAEAQAWGLCDGLPVRIAPGAAPLPAPAEVNGRVVRGDGTPAAHAVLLFRPLLEEDFPAPLPGLRVAADAEGRFAAGGFARVRYSVEARAPGCAARIVPEVLPGAKPLEIRLKPGFAVQGVVLATSGLPVAGARVRAIAFPEGRGDAPVATGEADEQGRFHLPGLGGTYARVQVSAPGYHATTLERVDPAAVLRVVLQRR
ncbi:MAG: carboxypeptidase-like regulatory domain-containing protein [Planctomycetota bacterium]|jgi:hypothetical protein